MQLDSDIVILDVLNRLGFLKVKPPCCPMRLVVHANAWREDVDAILCVNVRDGAGLRVVIGADIQATCSDACRHRDGGVGRCGGG
jgi:hypothetical protein